jgi:hypothetical protein
MKPKTPIKTFVAFRPEPELARAMAKLQERDGITTTELLRRSVRMFLKHKGILKPEPKGKTR